VLNQTFPHFRVCIYDDASGDDTAATVSEAVKEDPRVRYHCHAERTGLARNFLFGMERVETPYFSFLSDDDVLLPDFYRRAMEGFQKFPEAAFSALGVVLMFVGERLGALVPQAWPEGLCRPPDGLRNMLTMHPPLWTAILFRRELLEKVGLLDPEVGNAVDIDYEMRVVAHHPIVFSRRPGALGVVHPQTVTARTRLDDLWPGNMKMIRNTVNDQRLDPELRNLASQVMVNALKRKLFKGWGLRSIMEGRGDEARRSAAILSREFGEVGRARLLRLIEGIHRVFPPLRQVPSMALRVRRRWQRNRGKAAIRRQAQCFQEYEGFLNLG
jgi:glycosyltransferase involved in cell wall biosynthesis